MLHETKEFLEAIKLPDAGGKRLNYLVVVPRYVYDDSAYHFPIGLALISSSLKVAGRSVFTLNLNYKPNHQALLCDTIIRENIDVVLSGALSFQLDVLKEIFDVSKRCKPDIITVAGGGIVTAEPDVALRAIETADYGVAGEGEIAVNDLAYALEHNETAIRHPQIFTPDGGGAYDLSNVPQIDNLDMLPFPDYESFEYEALLRHTNLNGDMDMRTSVSLSRSCPYLCTFCFHPTGQKYRRRSIDNIFIELDYLVKRYRLTFIRFVDELFIASPKYITEFCARVKPYGLQFWCQTRVDTVNRAILLMLKDSGCSIISYGVESADNRILKSMKKHTTIEQVNNAYALAEEVSLPAQGTLIFGDPEETLETIANSLKWVVEHPRYYVYVSWIICFPGSEDYRVACEKGVITDKVRFLKDKCPQVNISRLTDEEYWDMVDRVRIFWALFNAGIYVGIEQIDIAQFREKLNALEYRKLAVWPATLKNCELIEKISPGFLSRKNVYLINKNPEHKWAKEAERYGKIQTPDAVALYNIDTVFCPSSVQLVGNSGGGVAQEVAKIVEATYPSVSRFLTLSGIFGGTI